MKRIRSIMFVFVILSMVFGMCSCAGGHFADDGGYGGGSYEGGWSGDAAPEVGGDSGTVGVEGDMPDDSTGGDEIPDDKGDSTDDIRLPAGMITAGAWVDNDNYEMWLDLFAQGGDDTVGKFYGYTTDSGSWGFNSLRRISVSVTSGEVAVAGATVTAKDADGNPLFVGVTDAKGNAYLFAGAESGTVTVTSGDGRASAEFTAESRDLTLDLATSAEKLNVIEMMLIVDVTGSMGDEIGFLKAELADVINRVCAADENTVVSLALLFYRDKTDNEMFAYYDFANVTTPSGMDAQQSAISSQRASGGGDYPEAVDEALELAVNKQWSDGATTKLIFFVLDAPPHNDDQSVERFYNATKIAAEKGIRICPILCSGAAGLTEYVMREAAIHTIGDLARLPVEVMQRKFGKNGVMLWKYANGLDESRVAHQDYTAPAKSVGHGITCVADLLTPDEAKKVIVALSQDIGYKLRLMNLRACAVQLYVRDNNLNGYGWQAHLEFPTQDEGTIAREANKVLESRYIWRNAIRALTVSAIQLENADTPTQLGLFYDNVAHERRERLNRTVDMIRDSFGKHAIVPAIILDESKMPRGKNTDIIMPGFMY